MTSAGTKQLRAQSRSCWWVCKWAVSAMESSLQNTPFQYVTGREKPSLLGCSHQSHSISCPLTSRQRMYWRSSVAPSCIKHRLLKTLSIYLYRLWQSCKYLNWIFQILSRRCLLSEEGIKGALGVAGTNPPTLFSGTLMLQHFLSTVDTRCLVVCFYIRRMHHARGLD